VVRGKNGLWRLTSATGFVVSPCLVFGAGRTLNFMERRDFIDPRHVGADAASLKAEPAEPVHLRFARRAMATTFEVIVPFGTPAAHELAVAALDEIDRIEGQLTVYRESSEVSRLNARAHRQPVMVEKGLFDLLVLARQLQAETQGAFDVAVGALIKAWGFYRRQGRVPEPAELQQVRQRIGSEHVCLDAQRQTVAFARPGLEINLGSIGKGYALDRAAALIQRGWGKRDVLLHGGHSSVLAFGRESPVADGWAVGLTDPERPECRRALLRLRDRAMATSAATYQHLEYQGRKLGHILDPRTAWPAERVIGATVTAPTAAVADALATAFFILGPEATCTYCDTHPEIGAVLITRSAPHRLLVFGQARAEIEVLR
jgi:FAD:protein FMN transferase